MCRNFCAQELVGISLDLVNTEGKRSYSKMIPECPISINRKGKFLKLCFVKYASWNYGIIVMGKSLLLLLSPLTLPFGHALGCH